MIQSLLIALVVCIDSLSIGISYGIKNIKIPRRSLFIINLVTIITLGISMFLGYVAKQFVFEGAASIISCVILVSLGCFFILEEYVKNIIKNKKSNTESDDKIAKIKLSSLGIVINVAIDATNADMDVSGDIDSKEAIYLGTALSLDSLGVGFGSAIGVVNYYEILIFTFVLNMIAIVGGLYLGKKLHFHEKNSKASFIAGAILIVLGLLKLT